MSTKCIELDWSMTSPTLTELASRVERLTGPCRETDVLIARNLGWTFRPLSEVWVCYDHDNGSSALVWIMPDAPTYQYEGREYIDSGYYHHEGPPEYSASLDAAMTLVPEGWRVNWAGECPDRSWFFELIERNDNGATDRLWAATPALALTAAALRARAANV